MAEESTSPRPGTPVRGSTTGRPIMALLDLLGRRWALRVLWEVHGRPGQTFRELQSSCGDISGSVLRDRLRELSEAGIVERGEFGYQLSAHGKDLVARMLGLDDWARKWARRQR